MSKLWSVEDVAAFLDVPVKTIYEWRTKKYGPPAKRVGRYLRFKPELVQQWFDALDDYVN